MKTYVHASDEDLEQGRQALAKIHRIGPVRDCERTRPPGKRRGHLSHPQKMALTCGFSRSARAWGRVNRNRTLMHAFQPAGAGETSYHCQSRPSCRREPRAVRPRWRAPPPGPEWTVVMTAQQQFGLMRPGRSRGMTTRTTALATQQQLRSAEPGSTAWRQAASKIAAAPSPFLADECRNLAFMPSASPFGPGPVETEAASRHA